MSGNSKGNELPAWAIPVGVVVAVLIVAFLGWRALGNHDSSGGKDVSVHPGMYDFRKAAATGELGKHTSPSTGTNQNTDGKP